ncbi:MAG TPA: hypothetical protein VFN10_14080 [Thermoanaerobaculia bacterium]|nr:hypothetical protein [Thermoanaerobaculia bacterium]
MTRETADTLVARIDSMSAEIDLLQAAIDAEELAPNQRQYISRCFELLHIELTTVTTYIKQLR